MAGNGEKLSWIPGTTNNMTFELVTMIRVNTYVCVHAKADETVGLKANVHAHLYPLRGLLGKETPAALASGTWGETSVNKLDTGILVEPFETGGERGDPAEMAFSDTREPPESVSLKPSDTRERSKSASTRSSDVQEIVAQNVDRGLGDVGESSRNAGRWPRDNRRDIPLVSKWSDSTEDTPEVVSKGSSDRSDKSKPRSKP